MLLGKSTCSMTAILPPLSFSLILLWAFSTARSQTAEKRTLGKRSKCLAWFLQRLAHLVMIFMCTMCSATDGEVASAGCSQPRAWRTYQQPAAVPKLIPPACKPRLPASMTLKPLTAGQHHQISLARSCFYVPCLKSGLFCQGCCGGF